MTFEEIMKAALTATGIEVTQIPVKGNASRYLTWELTGGRYDKYASNVPGRVRIDATIHLYARIAPTTADRKRIFDILTANHVRVTTWGAMTYEHDTQWYHLPINARVSL